MVLDADARRMSTLNAVGRLLWETLETPHDAAELVAVLQAAFPEVDDATLTADVRAFLVQMREAGLTVDADAAG